jgi:O-antigen ligase
MSAATHTLAAPASGPALRISLERLRGLLLTLTGFAGAFVFIEPSPYEVVALITVVVAIMTGLTLRPTLMPLALLLILSNVGFSIAIIPLVDQSKPVTWVLVSWFMAITALFYAAVLTINTQARLRWLTKGYTVGALVASVVAILAYFHLLPSSDTFLLYGRARGTFNDPNVLSAFLIFPALLALQRVVLGNAAQALRAGGVLVVILTALLLSFSRAAWGQFVICGTLMLILMLLTAGSARERARIIAIAIIGAVALALIVAALLSLDQVADLFKERASLDQSYDEGHYGRFGRYILGFQLALDRPFGIGPYQFGPMFSEDPHNTYLNAFMCGGWLSGLCYPAIVLLTVFRGMRFVGARTPWQPVYLAVYAAYLGAVGESTIIDIDHWRHYFLLLGTLWGLMIASQAYLRRPQPSMRAYST